MADHGLERLYDVLDEPPSPEFTARLRSRIERELAGPAATAADAAPPDHTVIEVTGSSATRDRNRLIAIAATLLVAVVAVGLAVLLVGGDDDNSNRFETPGPITIDSPSTTAPAPESSARESAVVTPTLTAGWSAVPAPPCDLPGQIAVGTDGSVWYGSDAGLYRWNGEDWDRFTHDDGLPTSAGFDPDAPARGGGPCGAENLAPTVMVAAGADGSVWAAASDYAGFGGIASLERSTFVRHPDPPSWARSISDVWVDDDGGVWVVATDGADPSTGVGPSQYLGMARLGSDDAWQEFDLAVPLSEAQYRPVVGPTGDAFFVSPDAVHHLVDGAWQRIEVASDGVQPFDAAVDLDGTLWVLGADADQTTVVASLVDSSWRLVEAGPTLFQSGLYVDDEGLVWAPTWYAEGDFVEPCCALPGLAVWDGSDWVEHPLDVDLSPVAGPEPPFAVAGSDAVISVTGPYSSVATLVVPPS